MFNPPKATDTRCKTLLQYTVGILPLKYKQTKLTVISIMYQTFCQISLPLFFCVHISLLLRLMIYFPLCGFSIFHLRTCIHISFVWWVPVSFSFAELQVILCITSLQCWVWLVLNEVTQSCRVGFEEIQLWQGSQGGTAQVPRAADRGARSHPAAGLSLRRGSTH